MLNNALVVLFFLVITLTTIQTDTARGRNYQSSGLQRSWSDTSLDANRSSQFHRQPSLKHYRDHCSTVYKYDYVQLTLQWAPGVCSTSPQECKKLEDKHFTVHGMWPTIRGTQEPSNCCFDNTFDYKAVQPILPILNKYWFSYYDTDGNRRFWTHEWLKHGTCSRDIPNLRGEARYFGTTVQMAKDMRIIESLAMASIVPNNDRAYESSAILKALEPISQGKNIQIDCDYEHHQPIPVLSGLNFCFDGNLKPADCPEMKRKCQRKVIFPHSIRVIKKLEKVYS